jgi:Leucine-rich repeat (LRR) protein
MKTPGPFFGYMIRVVFTLMFCFGSQSVSAFTLPPAGTQLLADPQLQTCFDEQALANGWTTSEEVTALYCPAREIRDLSGLELFTSLRELDLSRNLIEFAIPIDQLSQLEVLDLSHNRLWDIFPLNSLFNLRELYLSGNRPSNSSAPGVSLNTVNPVILNNIGLTHLGVGGVPMGSLDQLAAYDFAQGISQNLLELDISNTGVFDIHALSGSPNLRVFKASGNQLFFPDLVDQLYQLEVLDLSHNALVDVYQLRFLQSLRHLNLSGNSQLTASQVQAVVLANPGLTHLYLAEIPLPDLNWLPAGLAGEFDLLELDISRTGQFIHLDPLIRYPGLRLLRAAGNGLEDLWTFNNLTQLETLDLSDNNLLNVHALSFLNNLTQINLSGSSGLPAEQVTSVIQSNPGLTHIGVSGIALGNLDWLPNPGPQGEYNLQELEIDNIGSLQHLGQVGQYPDLRVLRASGNQLQSMWSSTTLARLEVLDVSDNRLSNLFELQFIAGLEQLDLSGNSRLPFNEVQIVVQNNPGLTHLGIAEIRLNDLQWLPPVGPQGEYDLQELNISNTGDFFDLGPVSQYPNLHVLEAAGNGLRTAFPIDQLTRLEVLDLSNNELMDIFALHTLYNLRQLYLSGNRNAVPNAPGVDLLTLNQVISNNPEITHLGAAGVAIGNLNQLATFNFSSDAHIKLTELDVSNTGIVDITQVSVSSNLRVLKASGNQIDYVQPIQNLPQLEVLDLSHNRLYDIVPLQNLSSLRQLNLSGNDRLQFMEVQNVVFANPGLTHLGLADVAMTQITWLPGMTPGFWDLIELDISNTGSFNDLVPLESYRNLRVLKAAGNGLPGAWGIQQMLQLEVLDLGDNGLQDVSPLLALGGLRKLDLSGNGGLLSIDVQIVVQANPWLTHLSVAGIAFDGPGWLPAPGFQGEFDLQELDISNTFSFSVLTDVFQYPNLRVLRAAGNGLEYTVSLEQLSRLEILDLSDNQLWDAGQLQELHNLRQLNLSANSLLQLPYLQAIVQANPDLTHLGVAGIAMNDLNWIPQIGPQGEFNLQDLDVSSTGLLDLGVLSRFPNLRVLRAAGNELQNLYFGQRMSIEILDLSKNKLQDVFALSDLDNLRELYLSGNQPSETSMPGVDLATVNQAIIGNPGLTRLGIGGVEIGSLSQLVIFDYLNPVGANLVELDISNTGASDIFVISSLPQLQVLNASGNQIFDSVAFIGLQRITDLDLSDNDLNFVLPLGDLATLNRLDLRGNDNIPCTELDELETRFDAGVLIRPALCIVGMLPSIDILSPSQNAIFYTTDLVSLFAAAGDFEDGDLSGQIQWSSDLAGSLGSGQTLDLPLSAGNHVISASVVDSDGNAASDSVAVLILPNTAPAVTIDSIQNGAIFQAGELVTLSGTATDAEEGNISPAIQWQSNLDGALGSGASIQFPLRIGNHTISASITDGTGASTTQTVNLRINAPPQVSLTSPMDTSVYQQGDLVEFAGSANDPEDGDLNNLIQWHSDLDGSLGSGTQVSMVLSVGEHIVSASVTDFDGATSTQSVTVTINSPPQLDLLSPPDGSLFMLTEPVNLSARASDLEEGNISGSITWSSSLDGSLGSGGNLSITSLSLGTHTISASVTDSSGGTRSLTTQIEIDQIDLQVIVTGNGSRKKTNLVWSGSRTYVDIYKDGILWRTGGPEGALRIHFKYPATFKVCETGTDYCSPEVVVSPN